MDIKDISIEAQITCVSREIAMREQYYPSWVARGKKTQEAADREIKTMRAVRRTLMIAQRTHLLKPWNQPQE